MSSTVREIREKMRKQKTGYCRPVSLRTSIFNRRLQSVKIPVILRCDLLIKKTKKTTTNIYHH